MDVTVKELGELMQKARKNKRDEDGKIISQQKVADSIGVDRQSITDWECGRKHPSFLNVVKFCEYIGITLDDLLGVKKNGFLPC